MHALISTLPKPYEDQVLRMWDALEERFGSKYVRTATVPHFTWQLGDSYALESVIPLLEQLAAEVDSFDIVVQGVEHFVSQAPIVFLEIIKNPSLVKTHLDIWQHMEAHTINPNLLYSPALWHPHISLAVQDLSWKDLPDALELIRGKNLDWRVMIDHFSILRQDPDGAVTLEHHFQFGKGLIY
ncbi:MAG TPA: 2'-5' RNA ligase family protein [Anaerolineaceae bacterium]|jgi:2'-5' RNA ligase|nr:2'-5' RNA ligase family protein [Anaerolineaceae bacterium]HOA22218.1 2'-5' RNA ligase family protein [Anaerolineaceae bacterium]HOG77906.1 2'-5' RNA ligase family protein [Anaerolineaceae bacterium]